MNADKIDETRPQQSIKSRSTGPTRKPLTSLDEVDSQVQTNEDENKKKETSQCITYATSSQESPTVGNEVQVNVNLENDVQTESGSEWKTVKPKKSIKKIAAALTGDRHNRQEIVIGTQAVGNSRIISAGKTTWLFISRLGTSVEAKDIVENITEICGSTTVNCEELKPKFPGYRS